METQTNPDLKKWLQEVLDPAEDSLAVPNAHFPTDAMLAEYLASMGQRSDAEIKRLLRWMLSAVTSQFDTLSHWALRQALRKGNLAPEDLEFAESYHRMLRRDQVGVGDAWEGLTWVLERLPAAPGLVLQAIELYMVGQHGLPDDRIHALADASAIIRTRWVGNAESTTGRLEFLNTFRPRQFEALVAALWDDMGYEVALTSSSADGGYDVRAEKASPGQRDVVLIECKQRTSRAIDEKTLRALNGILDHQSSVRGVIVTTSRFSKPAKQFAEANARMELVEGGALVLMMNEHLGWDWPHRAEAMIRWILGRG